MANYHDEMSWEPLAEGAAPDHMAHVTRYLRDTGMWDLLGMNEQTPPPASKTSIKCLQVFKIIDENQTSLECPVCLKKFKVGDDAKKLPCKHTFHTACLLPWLEKVIINRHNNYNKMYKVICEMRNVIFIFIPDKFMSTVSL